MSQPRLGFIGLGWIGALRLEAVAGAGRAEIAALCDRAPERLRKYREAHPAAAGFADGDELIAYASETGLDGIVIATPNALHASAAEAAVERGLAVFCQKPLGLDAEEVRRVVDAARRADRLLDVDFSYRHTDGARKLRRLIADAELGRIFHVESIFHNAYGPDKAWCRDVALSGGGALLDLGVHQIDLPLWLLGAPAVESVHGSALRDGDPLDGPGIDDFTRAALTLEGGMLEGGALDVGAEMLMAVSWNAHAGSDCVYRVAVFGTEGGAELRNINGSFYDFELVLFRGTDAETLTRESREWMDRGILAWVDRLNEDRSYDPAVEEAITVAEAVDRIYAARREPLPLESAVRA